MGLADDFVQFSFGWAAAEGERAGEMLPVVQRKTVEIAGDEDFQRSAFFYIPRVFQKLVRDRREPSAWSGLQIGDREFEELKNADVRGNLAADVKIQRQRVGQSEHATSIIL